MKEIPAVRSLLNDKYNGNLIWIFYRYQNFVSLNQEWHYHLISRYKNSMGVHVTNENILKKYKYTSNFSNYLPYDKSDTSKISNY